VGCLRRFQLIARAILTVAGLSAPGFAAEPETTFEPLGIPPVAGALGSLPTDVSSHGDVIVGKIYDEVDDEPIPNTSFRWTPGGIEELPGCALERLHVSDDGTRIAGGCTTRDVARDPAVWVNGVYERVPLSGDFEAALIYGVSGDGLVLFGSMGIEVDDPLDESDQPIDSTQVFRHTNGASAAVGRLPGDLVSYFVAASFDGSAAVIDSQVQGHPPDDDVVDEFHGARFSIDEDHPEGVLVNLGPGAGEVSPKDISSDGATVVGDSSSIGGFRWRANTGMTPLPLPFGALGAVPYGVSGDGSVIVGTYLRAMDEISPFDEQRACIWTSNGPRDLQDLLVVELGLDLQGWHLTSATAISRDGLTIVGTGYAPGSPYLSGWRVGPPPSAVKLDVEPARMTIADWRGADEHEFQVVPPVVTTYGRTIVPVRVSVADDQNDGAPLPNATVEMSVESVDVAVDAPYVGLGLEPSGEGPEELTVNTGASGETTVYLIVDGLNKNVADEEDNATGFSVSARYADSVQTVTVPVEDNRASIISKYRAGKGAGPEDYIPDGVPGDWRSSFLPPLGIGSAPGALFAAIIEPGNSPVRGENTILCTAYQTRVLVLLNDIRHSDEGWLFNGLDYSPVQTLHTEHHFVVLYPSDDTYKSVPSRILDPWLPQTVAVYHWEEYARFVDAFGRGDNIVPDVNSDPDKPGTCRVMCGEGHFAPPAYPAAGGRYPYFPTNASLPIDQRADGCQSAGDWCIQNGFGGTGRPNQPPADDHATAVVGSPVQFLVTMPDGRRFGFTGAARETYVNDFAGEFSTAFAEIPETSGGRGLYVEVPPGPRFRLDFPAIEDGTMDVVVFGRDGVWGGWPDVPIRAGRTTGVDVDLDAMCPAFFVQDAAAVPCERPTACTTEAECPSDDPCVPRSCTSGRCMNLPLTGLAAAACVCDRAQPAACAGVKMPRPLAKATRSACRVLGGNATKEKKRLKLLARAGKSWRSAAKLLSKRGVARKLPDACRAALSQGFTDAWARADRERTVR
jgi:uncharacterized membrane protein